MSDEPLYCSACGQEYCDCEPNVVGPYCETCGVVPAPGKECHFHKKDGRSEPCESK
jgi:hypothetical protein